jgi:hypothetical protein
MTREHINIDALLSARDQIGFGSNETKLLIEFKLSEKLIFPDSFVKLFDRVATLKGLLNLILDYIAASLNISTVNCAFKYICFRVEATSELAVTTACG